MDDLRSYLLSLILTSVICTVLPDLLRDGTAKSLIKTVCGLILAVTVLSPLRSIRLELPEELPLFQAEAAFAAEQGETLAGSALAAVICDKGEAYILDKGAQWGADIQVELTLSRDCVPVAVTISGEISPEGRNVLQELLETQFAIPKEAQTWIP